MTTTSSPAATIRNHTVWYDTDGKPIDCHEGAIIRVGDTFYWYGRVYADNPEGIYGINGSRHRCGFICYSSTDLVNWKNRGMILTYPDSGWMTQGTFHRPRMIYNAATKKYVLWFFCLEKPYPPPAVVATADAPTGPFTILGRVKNDFVSGDLAVLLEEDGTGYLCHDGGPTGRQPFVTRMADDFLSLTGESTLVMPPATHHEGECIARYKGKYIVAASGISGVHAGVGPSDSYYAVADAPLGSYEFKGMLSEPGTLTWKSQIGSFFYIAESDTVLVLCDQWFVGTKGEEVTCDKSQQLWLPLAFDPATGTAKLEHLDEWDPFAKRK